MNITYKAGYRYQLTYPYYANTKIRPGHSVRLGPIALTPDGDIHIAKYYAWDGPSGPPRYIGDIPFIGALYRKYFLRSFMRGSLIHDALYQLMRHGLISRHYYKDAADRELQRMCIEDGMSRLRSVFVYWAVRLFGHSATLPSGRQRVYYAP